MSDDLTILDGVGPKRATALRQVGIVDLATLAASDVGGLTMALHELGEPISEQSLRDWIAQAADHLSTGTGGWTPAAMFMVYFEERGRMRQTIVRHVDADADTQWPGYDPRRVGRWIRSQLEDMDVNDALAATPTTLALAEGEFVSAIMVYQPSTESGPLAVDAAGNIQTTLTAGEPFVVQLETKKRSRSSVLTVSIRLIGGSMPPGPEYPSASLEEDGATVRIEIPGVVAGLYRLMVVSRELEMRQNGPLMLVE